MVLPPNDRRTAARNFRIQLANDRFAELFNPHTVNGDESHPDRIANFTKGLAHHPTTGEPNAIDYDALKAALDTTQTAPDKLIPIEGITVSAQFDRKYVNPIAGLSFAIEGADSHHRTQPPAPTLNSEEAAAEMAELYWMALLRDIDFDDYHRRNEVQEAVDALNAEFPTIISGPFWPKDSAGNLTHKSIFRGVTPGDNVGPYISQFLLKGTKDELLDRDENDGYVKYGATEIDQRIVVGKKRLDYMTDFQSWLKVQNGVNTFKEPLNDNNAEYFDRKKRFIRNFRDLSTYVHFDALYQAYLTACLYLLTAEYPLSPTNRYPLSPTNPYLNLMKQAGFGTLGDPHILALVPEVATRALQAVWLQKWYVHRRLRPEAFGGLIHVHKSGIKNYAGVINDKILSSSVLDKVKIRNKKINEDHNRGNEGTYLLSQAFSEGSPMHPSYVAGHATVAGACVTILKAWFDESAKIRNPVQANEEGDHLNDYNGPDKNNLTVGGELNKLASNIAIGRNGAGVHYRSDYTESIRLGEEIAHTILVELKEALAEKPNFQYTSFFGGVKTI
ncbi:MAG: vanadium-dependent haloperoxidase [Nitrososphaeraceae archaeon]